MSNHTLKPNASILVKWTMVAFVGSRTAVKGLDVFKKDKS